VRQARLVLGTVDDLKALPLHAANGIPKSSVIALSGVVQRVDVSEGVPRAMAVLAAGTRLVRCR
jgi:hypothetical protein